MKPSTSLALSALLTLAMGVPMEKRDVVTRTITEDIVETVNVITTIWVQPGQFRNHLAYHQHGGAVTPANVPSSRSTPSVAPQVNAPVQQQQKAPVYQQPQASPKEAAKQAPAPAPVPTPAPSPVFKPQQAQVQEPPQHQKPPPQQPSPPAQAPPPSQSSPLSSGSGGPSGGACGTVGGKCSGDVTIYNDQGAGACGWTNDTNSQDFFALAHEMMGPYTNDAPQDHKNAFCGRSADIIVNGKTFTGMLTDKCGGCDGESIDLSQHLFSQLYPNEPPGNGRYHNVEWYFTDEGIYHGAS